MTNLKQQILNKRTELLLAERNKILSNHELTKKAILTAARNKVSKHYHKLKEIFGIEIVMGEGGSQVKRITELERNGIPFIHIKSNEYSEANDIAKGF